MDANQPLVSTSALYRFEQRMCREDRFFCGDSGFCRPYMLSWCESNRVAYIVGIVRNMALAKKAAPVMELAAKAEHAAQGANQRYFQPQRRVGTAV